MLGVAAEVVGGLWEWTRYDMAYNAVTRAVEEGNAERARGGLMDDLGTELNSIALTKACGKSGWSGLEEAAKWATVNRSLVSVPELFDVPMCPPVSPSILAEYASCPIFQTMLYRQSIPTAAAFTWRLQKLLLTRPTPHLFITHLANNLRYSFVSLLTKATSALIVRSAGFSYRWETPLCFLLIWSLGKVIRYSKPELSTYIYPHWDDGERPSLDATRRSEEFNDPATVYKVA